jgi:hypothetical protein
MTKATAFVLWPTAKTLNQILYTVGRGGEGATPESYLFDREGDKIVGWKYLYFIFIYGTDSWTRMKVS